MTDRLTGQLLLPSCACTLRVNKQTNKQQQQQQQPPTNIVCQIFFSKLTVYQSLTHIVTYKTCNYLYEVIRLTFGNGHQYYTVSCQVAYGLSGCHGSYDLS